METCVGCGAKSGRHAIVGVAALGDVDGYRIAERDGYAAHPVCMDCWRVPSRRKPGQKMHFFPREHLHQALEFAGSENIG